MVNIHKYMNQKKTWTLFRYGSSNLSEFYEFLEPIHIVFLKLRGLPPKQKQQVQTKRFAPEHRSNTPFLEAGLKVFQPSRMSCGRVNSLKLLVSGHGIYLGSQQLPREVSQQLVKMRLSQIASQVLLFVFSNPKCSMIYLPI